MEKQTGLQAIDSKANNEKVQENQPKDGSISLLSLSDAIELRQSTKSVFANPNFDRDVFPTSLAFSKLEGFNKGEIAPQAKADLLQSSAPHDAKASNSIELGSVIKPEAALPQKASSESSLLADAIGVAATFATKYGAEEALKALPLPATAKVALGMGLGLIAGGTVNKEISGSDWRTGMIRNVGLSAVTYGGTKFFQSASVRAELSEPVLAKLGMKSGLSAAEVAPLLDSAVSAERAAAGNSWGAAGIKDLIEPADLTNMVPFKFSRQGIQYIGAGEKAAQMVANGTMTAAEWDARVTFAKAGSLFATGYGVSTGYQAIDYATGQKTWKQDSLAEINRTSMYSGATSMLVPWLVGIPLRPLALRVLSR